MSTIDVCVVTYNSEDTVGALIQSVVTHLPAASIKVLDNSPNGRTRAAIHASPDSTKCQVWSGEGNLGFGAACNRLAEYSTADWLIFLNPDAEIAKMQIDFREHQKAIIGPVIFDPTGKVQRSFGPERTLGNELAIRLFRRPQLTYPLASGSEIAFVSGAAFAIHRSDFLRLKGFDDDRFFMYYEDIDFCKRARNAGMTVAVAPSWEVHHVGGHSAKQAHLVALMRSHISARNYHRKWGNRDKLFHVVATLEALLKFGLSVFRGEVGQTSRATQWKFLSWLLRGGKRP